MSYFLINNKFIKNESAQISCLDRGFRFGEGLFETIRVYRGKIYQWGLHISRLKNGLNFLDINIKDINLFESSISLIHKNKLEDGLLKIIITSGDRSIGYLRDPESSPSIIIETINSPLKALQSFKTCISSYIKPGKDVVPTEFKILHNLNSVLAKKEASKLGFYESLQLTNNGTVSEFSSGNIFWVIEDSLYTPSLECNIINGCIRNTIIKNTKYKVTEGEFGLDHLKNAKEIFMTNSNNLVSSIHSIDNLWHATGNSISLYHYDLVSNQIKNIKN